MSLRMSSLDPNEPRAGKDCRTCNRRRIKCDRSLPTCKKCSLKNLHCPGYGLRIRWGSGVASRGKLTGKSIPVLDDGSGESAVQDSSSPASLATDQDLDYLTRPSLPRTSSEFLFNNQFAFNFDFSTLAGPPQVLLSSNQRLLKYYDHVVTPLMVWLDGPSNEWRVVMLPLALECPSLMLAILALSAEHYTSKTGTVWQSEDGATSKQFRDESLRILAQDLRNEMSRANAMGNEGPVSEILATTIVLCNMEMIRSNSDLWRVHWGAVRTITRRLTSDRRSVNSLDATCRYLVMEAFMYDVFASCSTFDGGDLIPGELIHPDDNDVLVEFLQLIQEITTAERARYSGTSQDDFSHLRDLNSLLRRFDYCREQSFGFARAMQYPSPDLYDDFIAVVDMYHCAGILYACQALIDANECAILRRDCMNQVMECFQRIKHTNQFEHDIVWTIFMAGSEARGSKQIQSFAEARFISTMEVTGWDNLSPALAFLKRFWTTDVSTTYNWIQYAREESMNGFSFLVI